LTYNLVQDLTLPRQTAATLDANHARLENVLTAWTVEYTELNTFVYPLEHEYTEASLCANNLKGPDAAKARYVDTVCAKTGVYWFLGRMTRETEGEYGEEEEQSLSIDHVITPDGRRIMNTVVIEHDEILADEAFFDRTADSEDEGEWTGNEGMNNTYRYRNTVLILFRKEAFFKKVSRRKPSGSRTPPSVLRFDP
jgi:hypothetical protein